MVTKTVSKLIKSKAILQGGSHPHLLRQRPSNRGVLPKTKHKDRAFSARTVFRQSKNKIKVDCCTMIIPAVMAARKDEHFEFVACGPDMVALDVAHLDIAAIRNALLLYDAGICHIDITEQKMHLWLSQAKLQNEEPYWCEGMREYYKNKGPDIITDVKEDCARDPMVFDFIVRLIKKFGGSLRSMLTKSAEFSVNMTPHVWKTRHQYGIKAMDMPNPKHVTTCCNCNTVNFVWLEDQETGVHGQMCGLCNHELDEVNMRVPNTIFDLAIDDKTSLRVGAIQLEHMSVTNQLDGTPDMSNSAINTLISQDLKNVRNIMSRKIFKTVKVENGLTKSQLNYLKEHNLSFNLVEGRTTPNPHAMLASERKMLWHSFAEKLGDTEHMVEIGSRRCRDDTLMNRWHGIGPNLDWRDLERYGPKPPGSSCCDHTVESCVCNFENRSILVAIDSLYDIPSEHIIKFMSKHNIKHMLYCLTTAAIDFNDTSGQLYFNQGMWCRDNNRLLTVLNGDDIPYDNNFELTKMWSVADVIHCGKKVLSIGTYQKLGNHIARVATLSDSLDEYVKHKFSKLIHNNTVELTVPIINADSWLSVTKLPVLTYQRRTIYLDLYKALYTRNLTGGLSYEKMVEYGLAYAHVKYQTPTKTISHRHITADDVRLHSLLAIVQTRRKFGWISQSMSMANPDNTFGIDQGLGIRNGTMQYLISVIKSYAAPVIKEFLSENKLDNIVATLQSWMDEAIWEELDNLAEYTSTHGLIEYKCDPVIDVTLHNKQYICNHHTSYCFHESVTGELCVCCRTATVDSGHNKCYCCEERDCQHKCNHTCQGPSDHLGDSEKTSICDCCGVKHGGVMCMVCNTANKKFGSQQEVPIWRSVPEAKQLATTPSFRQKDPPVGPKHTTSTEPIPTMVPLDPPMPEETKNKILEEWKRMNNVVDEPVEPSTSDSINTSNILETMFAELVQITSLEYGALVRKGWDECVARDLIRLPDYNVVNRVGVSELRFIPAGKSTINTDRLHVQAVERVEGSGLCGYYAINHALNNQVSINALRQLSGVNENFNNHHLACLVNQMGYNICIVLPNFSELYKVDSTSDKFVCIRHSSVVKENTNHWEPVNVIQAGLPNTIPDYEGMISTKDADTAILENELDVDFYNNDEVIRVKTVLEIVRRTKYKSFKAANSFVNLNIVKRGVLHYLSNNNQNVHMPSQGYLCFEIPDKYLDLVQLCTKQSAGLEMLQLQQELYDLPPLDKADVNEVIKGCISETVAELNNYWMQVIGQKPPERHEWRRIQMKTVLLANKRRTFNQEDLKLKSGDCILLELNGVIDYRFVTSDKLQYIIDNYGSSKKIDWVTMLVPKLSLKSSLVRLMSLVRPKVNFELFKKSIWNSQITYGPGGSGKSTSIIHNMDDSTLVVARTRVSTENLKNKAPNRKKQILTYEKFLIEQCKVSKLVFDECTMFTWLDVFVALGSIPDLILGFGDPYQIGVIDTNKLGGTREVSDFGQYSKNINYLTTTYRYGQALCSLLPGAGIVSKCEHNTEVILMHQGQMTEELLNTCVSKHKPDVILTHYNSAKNKIKAWRPDQNVSTIHSFQAQEADTVLVIQWNTENPSSSLWLESKWAVSAATRAKRKLIWLSIGLPSRMKLKDLLAGQALQKFSGGGNEFEEIDLETKLYETIYSPAVTASSSHVNTGPNVCPKTFETELGLSDKEIQLCDQWEENVDKLVAGDANDVWYNWSLVPRDQLISEFWETTIPTFTTEPIANGVKFKNLVGHVTFVVGQDNIEVNATFSSVWFRRGVIAQIEKTQHKLAAHRLINKWKQLGVICWFSLLPDKLKQIATNRLPELVTATNKLGVQNHNAESDEEFEDANDHFADYKVVFPIPDDVLKRLFKKCSLSELVMEWWKQNEYQYLEVKNEFASLISMRRTCGNMQYEIIKDNTFGEITSTFSIFVENWNKVMSHELNESHLYFQLTEEQQKFILTNFSLFHKPISWQPKQIYEVDLEGKYLVDTLNVEPIDDLSIVDTEGIPNANRSNNYQRDNSLPGSRRHFCTQSNAWWRNRSEFGGISKIFEVKCSSKTTQMIRLMSEDVQLYEFAGDIKIINVCDDDVAIKSLGGCSLCCGLNFSINDEPILLISPQRSQDKKRKILVFGSDYSAAVLSLLQFFEVDSSIDTFWLGEFPDVVDSEGWLHDKLYTPHYELGMMIERISTIPKVLYDNYKTLFQLKSYICHQYDKLNKSHIDNVKLILRDNWKLSVLVEIPTHMNITFNRFKVVTTNKIDFVSLINGKIYTTNSNCIKPSLKSSEVTVDVLDDLHFVCKLSQWQWELSRHLYKIWTSVNSRFGFYDTFELSGLNLPLEYHRQNNTEVYQYLRRKNESETLGNIIKSYHIVYVHQEQYKNYLQLLKQDCQNLPIEVQAYDVIERGFDQLVETLMTKYFYNGVNNGETAQMVSDYPYLSIMTSSWGCCIYPNMCGSRRRYTRNILDCHAVLSKIEYAYSKKDQSNKSNNNDEKDEQSKFTLDMLESVAYQKSTLNGPWFTKSDTELPSVCTNLLLGLTCLQLSPSQLIELMQRCKLSKAHIICPIKLTESNKLFRIIKEDGDKLYVGYDGSEDVTIINKRTYDLIMRSNQYTHKGLTIISHCNNIVLGHSLCSLILLSSQQLGPKYTRPQIQQVSTLLIRFRMPKLNPMKLMLSKLQWMDNKIVEIDSRLYRALSLRMLRPNTKLDDLLAYARTYAHTVAYSTTGYSGKLGEDVTNLMESCACVYYESKRSTKSTEDLMQVLTNSVQEQDVSKLIYSIAKNIGLNALSDIFKFFEANITIDQLLTLIKELVQKSDWNAIRELQQLTFVKLTKELPHEKIIYRGGSRPVKTSYGNNVNALSNMVLNIGKVLLRGTRQWVKMNGIHARQELIKSNANVESTVSGLCRFLEQHVGNTITNVVTTHYEELVTTYGAYSLHKGLRVVMAHFKEKIELLDRPGHLTQMESILNLSSGSLGYLNKPQLDIPLTEDCMMLQTNILKLMYPDQTMRCNKKILFSTVGSMGDVEPFLGLACLLRTLGAECIFAIPKQLVDHVQNCGFKAHGYELNVEKLIESCILMEHHKYNPLQLAKAVKNMFGYFEAMFNDPMSELLQMAEDCNLIVETPFTHAGVQIADKHSIPLLLSTAYPWEYHRGVTTRTDKMSLMELLTGVVSYAPFIGCVNQWRIKHLNVGIDQDLKILAGGSPMLYLHSHKLTSWPISCSSGIVGYPLCVKTQMTNGEIRLLQQIVGKRVACICLGSMVTNTVIESTNKSVLMLSNYFDCIVVVTKFKEEQFGFNAEVNNVKFITQVDYHKLFPLTELVVTHGGSGTTHNAIRYANVVVIQPFFGDQFAWLSAVIKNGIGNSLEFMLNCNFTQWFSECKRNVISFANDEQLTDWSANVVSSFDEILNKASDHMDQLKINNPWPVTHLNVKNHDKVTKLMPNYDMSVEQLDENLERVENFLDSLSSTFGNHGLLSGATSKMSTGTFDLSDHNDDIQDDLENIPLDQYDIEAEHRSLVEQMYTHGVSWTGDDEMKIVGSTHEREDYTFLTSKLQQPSEVIDDSSNKVAVTKLQETLTPEFEGNTSQSIDRESQLTSTQFSEEEESLNVNKSKGKGKIHWADVAEEDTLFDYDVCTYDKIAQGIPVLSTSNMFNALSESTSQSSSVPSLLNQSPETDIRDEPPTSSLYAASKHDSSQPSPLRSEIVIEEGIDLNSEEPIDYTLEERKTIDHANMMRRLALPELTTTRLVLNCEITVDEMLFNSTTEGLCAIESIEYLYQRALGADAPEFPFHTLQQLCVATHLPNMNEIIAMLLLMGLKAVVVFKQTKYAVNVEDPGEVMVLLMTSAQEYGHVTVHRGKLLSVQYGRPVTRFSNKTYELLNKELMGSNTLNDNQLPLITSTERIYMILTSWGLNMTIEELEAKLRFNNIYYTTTRARKPMYFSQWQTDTNCFLLSDPDWNIKNKQLVLMQYCYDWTIGVVVRSGTITVLKPIVIPTGCFTGLVCKTEIYCEKHAFKPVKRLTHSINPDPTKVTCLNELTLSKCKSTPGYEHIRTVRDQSASIWLVSDTDGRLHHKYDERQTIKNVGYEKFQGVMSEITTAMLEKVVECPPHLRYCIRDGDLYCAFEVLNEYVRNAAWKILHNLDESIDLLLCTIHVPKRLTGGQISDTTLDKIGKLLDCTNGRSAKRPNQALINRWTRLSDDLLNTLDLDKIELMTKLGDVIDNFEIQPTIFKGPTHIQVYAPINQKFVMIRNDIIFIRSEFCFYKIKRTVTGGGNEVENRVSWKLPDDFKPTSQNRWWDTNLTATPSAFRVEDWVNKINTESINYAVEKSKFGFKTYTNSAFEEGQNSWLIHEQPTEWPKCINLDSFSTDDVQYHHMTMWDDTDFSDWNEKFAPLNNVKVFSRTPATQLRVSGKCLMTDYPIYSRPVLTKAANAEFNAITGRLCRVENYRKFTYDLQLELQDFINVYFDKSKLYLLNEFQNNLLTFNDNKVLDWLKDRPDHTKIAAELEMILSTGMEVNPINNINVHLKLESLLKENPADDLRQVKPRALMWQCKGYCSIFSHIFKELKVRLKQMLREDVLYSDGLRADELSSRVRTIKDFDYFFENDLAQQDRQTDHEIIRFEMVLYKLLGGKPSTIDLWHKCHFNWKYKSATVMGVRDAMRLTGQATTALGNAITNLLVHKHVVRHLNYSMKLFLVLGDDGLILTKQPLDITKLNKQLKLHHNMMCKPALNCNYGTFCCMLLTKNHMECATLGPDFCRLRRRYEVTNGVSEATDDNINARAMSYLMMLGATPEVMNVIKMKNYPIEPLKWYDFDSSVKAMSIKYNMSEICVLNEYNLLLNMIKEPKLRNVEVLHWEEKN